MLRRNKGVLVASSIVILLPMLLGFFGDTLLPEEFAVHWGLDGRADGFGDASIFFILPPICLAIHWLCMIVTAVVEKNAEQNKKLMGIMFWIIPVLSLVCSGMIVSGALGHTANAFTLICLLLGVMFIVIGNYLPKTIRSRTMGIKIKWAQANEENWRATHRFGGKVYVAIGFLCLLCMPLPMGVLPVIFFGIVLVGVLLPVIYSYRFYKKQLAEGTATKEDYEKGYKEFVKNPKATLIVSAILVPILILILSFLMFTGKIETTLGEDALTVEASFAQDMTVRYEDVDAVEYREDGVNGQRVMGFGSARLLLGTFQNEEFGTYTRYTYTGKKPCVVLTVDGKTVVVGTEDATSTKEIYDRISAEIAQ